MKSKNISTFFPCFGQEVVDINDNKNGDAKAIGWTPLLFLVCIASTVGTAVPVGHFLGVMNTLSEFIKTWSHQSILTRYSADLSESGMDVLWACCVSIFLVGGILGSTFGAWCSNTFGRKGCILISALLLILGGLLLCFCRAANSVEMLLAGRLLGGISAALIYTSHPMYLLEIAPAELRGTVGVFCAVGVTVGIVVGQAISLREVFGTEANWPYALGFYALLVAVCFAPSYWFPESPRWLYLIKRDEISAKTELRRLRGDSNDERINQELAEMEASNKAELASDTNGKSDYWSVLRDPALLLPIIIVCSFQFCQQLSGINAIFYYSVDIFTKAGFTSSTAAWMNFGAGSLNMVVSLLGPVLMGAFNRRPMMMISCLMCCVCLFGTTFALYFINTASWLPTACIILTAAFIIFFQFGLGPIPYFIGSEIFEVAPRSVAMSVGSLCSWIGNLLIGMGFPVLQGFVGAFAFLPCCAVCIYGFLVTWKYLPESRGRDASEIKPLMANGLRSRVRSRSRY